VYQIGVGALYLGESERTMTSLHDEPHFETRLWDVVQGGRDSDLMRHISTCDDCQEDLGALRELARYRATTGGVMAEVPSSLATRVAGLMPFVRPDLMARREPFAEGLAARIRRITAELLLDSGLPPQVAGLRSGGSGRTRQLAFVSEVADLDLEVSQFDDAYSVAGQLGMDTVPPNLQIRFVPADQDPLADDVAGLVQTAISLGGYFELTLTAGEWVAAVDIDEAVVLFPGVRL